jgi:hypothetical protein
LLPAKVLAQMEGFCEMQVHLLFLHYGGGAKLLAQDAGVGKGSFLHDEGMSKVVSLRRIASYSAFRLLLAVGGISAALAIIVMILAG